ncbi:peptidase domain-containing ABC transporter [Streptomyces griseomycini]|uniref:ABC-type bacteriocin/lantibiotic exporter with double-glycine peptidase domain n=1 Tax=Streptomyces griseomycini TaxID=66895 RepID=A0A7W7M204_9ACTN|nr:peptidase domain-containing ABC transporter [Streptomyces griseomycini]MBB4899711.1 ABC-type bacteriocin/lantibiotic exporter with double-glycine peptidase domain [Streptomyces griseomycini]GGP97458.1 NHLP family bacteriocin export ABC transporter peptidase/permease/ATPase [Streptomyces griseomycini]
MPRVPVIVQMSNTECGPSCLAMVLGGLGRATKVGELRARFAAGRDGTSARRIIEVARDYGLAGRGLRVNAAGLAEIRLPAIAHWGQNHFTVLEKVGSRRIRLVDPGRGRRSLTHEEFFAEFSGSVLEFTPGDTMQRRRRRLRDHLALRFLRDLVGLAPYFMLLAVVLSGLVQVLGLASAWATKYGVDTLVGQGADTLPLFAVGIGAYVVAQTLASLARGMALLVLQRRLDGSLGERFMTHLLGLPYAYFQTRGVGDLMSRLSSNMVVRDMLTSRLASLLLDSLFVVVYSALLVAMSPAHAAVVAVVAGAQVGIVLLTVRPVHERAQRELAADAKAQSGAIDALAGAEFLKSSGLSHPALRRWVQQFAESVRAGFHRRQLDLVNESAMGVFQVAAPLVLLILGIVQVTAGRMSLGTMLGLNVFAALLLAPVGQVMGALRYLQTIGSHLERIYDVLDEEPEPTRPQAPGPVELRGGIELRGVGFRYDPGAPHVLENIDFRVTPGSKLAIVGSTGSGKTTLSRLLTGLLRPTAGTVLVDGRPLDDYDPEALRRRFGVVTQFPYTFGGSIRENLTLGRPDAGDDELREALGKARFLEDLDRMPMGLDTGVGEGGGALSGGQRQRLAIARALLADPDVLLLDEATSHLDTLTEAAIAAELSATGCTRIVIAHRISTVSDADQILVLDHGVITERGDHQELMASGGRYAALVHQQSARLTGRAT